MSFQKQFHEDLAREYSFLGNTEEFPKKRASLENKSPPPAPKIIPKSSQLEKLINKAEKDTQQKKELKKQPVEANRLGAEIEDSDSRSSKSTPDFQKEQKKSLKQPYLRQEFPPHLLKEYPFLSSPTYKKDQPALLRLTDSRICKQETREVLDRLTRGL